MPSTLTKANPTDIPNQFSNTELLEQQCPTPDGTGLQLYFEIDGEHYVLAGPRGGSLLTVNGGRIDRPDESYFQQLAEEYAEETFDILTLEMSEDGIMTLHIKDLGTFPVTISKQCLVAYEPDSYAYLTFAGTVSGLSLDDLKNVAKQMAPTANYWAKLGGFLAGQCFNRNTPKDDAFQAYWQTQQAALNQVFAEMDAMVTDDELLIKPEQAFTVASKEQAWQQVREITDYATLRHVFSHTVGRFSERAGYYVFSAETLKAATSEDFSSDINDVEGNRIATGLFNDDAVKMLQPVKTVRKSTTSAATFFTAHNEEVGTKAKTVSQPAPL